MSREQGVQTTAATGKVLSFWEHLDELRWTILRSLGVVVLFAVVAFCMKDWLFAVVLAPHDSSFITFRMMGAEPFSLHLVNTALTEQFMTHMRTACYAGLLCALPYVLYELFRFVSPALYRNERRAAQWMVLSAYVMFVVGTLVCYFIIFPLTVRFLGTYQVSTDVENMLTLQSYMDTFFTLCLLIGLVFELPVVSFILGRLHVLSGSLMRHFRRHAVVAILIVAAIITPTTDVFTLLVVSLPIWLLYEVSIWLVPRTTDINN
ncbi:MAG: twin-arginine translocase subunit TatC [Prevotella sp.]|nr:twin-arginine translocase subunit TatC [Prevotella sp.]